MHFSPFNVIWLETVFIGDKFQIVDYTIWIDDENGSNGSDDFPIIFCK